MPGPETGRCWMHVAAQAKLRLCQDVPAAVLRDTYRSSARYLLSLLWQCLSCLRESELEQAVIVPVMLAQQYTNGSQVPADAG